MKSRRFGREGFSGCPAKDSWGRGFLIPRSQGPGQGSPGVAIHGDMEETDFTKPVRRLQKAKKIRKEGSPHRLETLFRGVKTGYVVQNKG
jgi:hypothetical protein